MNNYQCTACGLLVKHSGKPTGLGGCSKSGSGNHQWKDLGAVGNDAYRCTACNTTIYSDGRPNTLGGCDASGSGNHQWEKA